MKATGERYFPSLANPALLAYEPFITYEHWHRYRYAVPYCAGKVVLDIASGEGYGSALLAEHAAEVCGVDLSVEAVEHAARAYPRPNLRFVAGSAAEIPIPGEHLFDVVVSFETIEHLDQPSQDSFLREVRRLLKPDGVFLVSTPNRAADAPPPGEGNPYHLHELSRDEALEFLHGYFRRVRLLSQHVYPVSYIWGLDGERGPIAEYQLAGEVGKFRLAEGDGKETSYLIAVCADREEDAVAPDSLLVDLSKAAFHDIPGRDAWHSTSLFPDTGHGYRSEEVIYEQVAYAPAFEVTFAPESPAAVTRLRWDPIEARLCRVRIDEVTWRDPSGEAHALDLSLVSGNGSAREDGSVAFDGIDPMFELPVAGKVASLTIRGECWVEDDANSLLGLERALRAQFAENYRVGREIELQRGWIADRDHELEAKSRHIVDLDRHIVDLDRHVAELDRHIVDLDRHVAGLEAAVRERDKGLEWSRDAIAHRDREIQAAREYIVYIEERSAAQQSHIDAQAAHIGNQERWNTTREAELATRWAEYERAERGLHATREELHATREELSARDHALAECRDTLHSTSQRLHECETSLLQVLTSRRWVYTTHARNAVTFLPKTLRKALARVRGDAPASGHAGGPMSIRGRMARRREARASQAAGRGD